MSAKSEIRAAMRARRKAVTPKARAAAGKEMSRRLLTESRELGAALAKKGPIAVYLASKDEIDLADFITAALSVGCALVAPRWNGFEYELVRIVDLETLVKGPHGILEPPTGPVVRPEDVRAWVVPGLAFTREGKRLGYGGGWYDRLLRKVPKRVPKIGVAYAFQLVDEFPAESHDIRLTSVETCREMITKEEGLCVKRAVVSLGSNIEPRAEYLAKARAELSAFPETRFVRASSVVETEPVGVPEEFAAQKFLNQVAVFETGLGPFEFSRRMHAVEDALGRVRTVRNGPRTIDIDLVDFDGLVVTAPDLVLPHPRAHLRDFVMKPLEELGLLQVCCFVRSRASAFPSDFRVRALESGSRRYLV